MVKLSTVVLSILLVAGWSAAQTETAMISGRITDPSGSVIPGAEVELTSAERGLSTKTQSNEAGIYVFNSVRPGVYHMTVRKERFQRVDFVGMTVNTQDHIEQNFALKVGSITESVTVTGGAPLVNTQDASVGTVVDRRFVENIPLNGRTFQSLISSVPGVIAVPGPSSALNSQGEFSINGQRSESNYFTVDGVAANTGTTAGNPIIFGGSGNTSAESALGTTQSLVSLDALQEFRIQTSTYSAEYGRTPGGQIAFATRSGTNNLHGSAFDYLRNGVFDSNSWFSNAARIPKTSERQNDFGGTLGGPVMLPGYDGHNRTFFFVSYEGLRLSSPQPAITTFVPSLALRQSAPAPMKPFLNTYPLPNGPDNGSTGAAQLTMAWSQPGSLNATSVRLDHTFNSRLTVFGRYSYSPSDALIRTPSAFALSNPAKTSTVVKTLTTGATATFSPRFINELRFNMTWNDGRSYRYFDNLGGATPFDLSTLSDFNRQPTPGVDELQFLISFGGIKPWLLLNQTYAQRQINVVDTLSRSLGPHLLKFGFDFRQLNTPIHVASLLESAVFTSAAQIQQDLASAGSTVQAQASFPIGPVYRNLSLFAQDEWKVTPHLSVSMGLRWELNPPPGDAYGNPPYTLDQVGNLTTAKLAPKGTPLWRTTYRNFAPRISAAYQLGQKAGWETVVRGGFGVFYDLGNTYASNGYGGVGIGSTSNLANVKFPFTAAQLVLPAPSVAPPYNGTVTAFEPNLQLPYTLQWNVAVEQPFGQSQALTISYVGAAGRRLLLFRQSRPGVAGNTNFTSTGSLVLYRNASTSDYDALQVQFRRRLAHGLQANLSYVWSHSIDDASANSNVFQVIRASSDFDVRHNFQAAATYDVPGISRNSFVRALTSHWAFDPRITARSAFPIDVTSGLIFDVSGLRSRLRADAVPGQPLYISDAAAPGGRRINFNAFKIPSAAEVAALQFGTAPRNLLRAFSAWQADVALRREFRLRDVWTLQFRAEAFNLFNHPTFGAVQNDLTTGAAAFGRATGTLNNQLGALNPLYQTGGPRSLQFALKLLF